MKTLKTILSTGILAGLIGLAGCADKQAPKEEDFKLGKSFKISTSEGYDWIAKDLDEDNPGCEELVRLDRGTEVHPIYITKEYAKKIGKTIDGELIRELDMQMVSSISGQRVAMQKLSYLMAMQRYINLSDNRSKK